MANLPNPLRQQVEEGMINAPRDQAEAAVSLNMRAILVHPC